MAVTRVLNKRSRIGRVMATGTHACLEDERNASVLVNVNGELLPRKEATVSVFDAGFLLGDGVWEGLRLHKGKFAFLPEHLQRLGAGAEAIGLELPLSVAELEAELYRTVAANGMEDGAHVRLVVSRGPKATPFQDPRASAGGPTLVIIPEWKTPDPALYTHGIALVSVATRRPGPEVQDPRINSLSKHNCIQACREAAALGGDEGIMLDPHGNVSTCNSTHFFHVAGGEVRTSTGRYCLGGITRQAILRLCRDNDINCSETDFPPTALVEAEEAFVTGTFGGVTPARSIDSRALPVPGPVTARLRGLYERMLEQA